MNNLLGVAGVFKRADFDVKSDYAHIVDTDGSAEATYRYAPPMLIDTKPRKIPAFERSGIEFDLSDDAWTALQRATSLLNVKEIRIVSDGESVQVTTFDHKRPSCNMFSIGVAACAKGLRCSTVIGLNNLKFLKSPYHCIVRRKCTLFENVSGYNLKYYVASEPSSTFD